MDKWTSVPEMIHTVRLSVVKLTAILIALSLVGRDLGSAFGFAIGAVLALWQFGRLSNAVAKSLQMSKEAAQVYAASRYVLRYLTVAAVLAFVYFSEGLNFYAAFAAMLLVKVVIVGYAFGQVLREGGVAYLWQLAARRGAKGGDSDG